MKSWELKKTGNPLTRHWKLLHLFQVLSAMFNLHSFSNVYVYFLSVDRKEKFESLNQSWLILDSFHSKAMKRKEDLLAL